MSQAGTNPEDAVAHSRSRRRFKWWKALAFGVVFAGAVAAGLFFERKPIAALLVQAYLLKYGIASSVEFEELSRGGFVAHVRVGPEMPEFSADILDVTLDYDGFLALPQISTVRLVRPVLRASFDGKRFSFGSLQPLVDEALAKQPEGPGPSVTVEQGTLYVATPAGLLQLAVDVSVDKGKLNRLSAALSPVHLRSASLSGEIKDARLAATVTNEKLNGTVSFQIAALSSSASPDMESKDLEGNIDITGAGWRNTNNSLDIAAVKTTLAIKSASLNNSQNSAVQPELKLAVENPRARVSNGTIDVVAPRIVAGLHLAGFQAPEIATARSDAQLVLESVQAHLTGDAGDFAAQHANMTLAVDSFKSTQAKAGNSEIRLDIDALKTSYDGRAFRGSGRAEAATEFRRFSFGPHSVNVLLSTPPRTTRVGNGLIRLPRLQPHCTPVLTPERCAIG